MSFFFCLQLCFFFFKQKTAYEMRISDWSSDVCSSDLVSQALFSQRPGRYRIDPAKVGPDPRLRGGASGSLSMARGASRRLIRGRLTRIFGFQTHFGRKKARSEEHTSELQSLLRTSYAVFCLNKQTSRGPPITRENIG